MNQEPQSPLWPDSEIKTIAKRAPGEPDAKAENSRTDSEQNSSSQRKTSASFGERLQREREMRSITLDEIANSTKIGTRLLHALEAEEFDKLPGGIFNKGFVRAYARYLGLDEEQAVIDYLAAESEQDLRRRAPAGSQENRNSSQPQLFAIKGGSRPDNVYNIRANVEVVEQEPAQAGGFLMAAVILVFILGIGGFGWKYYSAHSAAAVANAPAAAAPQPLAPEVQTPVQTQPSNSSADSATTSGVSPTNTDATSHPSQTVADKPADIKTPADATTSTATLPTTKIAEKSSIIGKGFTLDLRADEQSWAQITADGKQLWSGIVDKDSTKSFTANKELVVKLGNAPGVELSYNGKSLPRFSQESKIRTLTFTPEGLSPR
jgi:cytoskeleton protein RodZ